MLIFATDNSTVEQAVYKGSSDSRLLLEMVIEFFAIQARFKFTILITHVAGTRMIACGSDGLSRGSTNEGILNGEDFLSFLPLHLSALDRSPKLKELILDWSKQSGEVIFLKPEDWSTFPKGWFFFYLVFSFCSRLSSSNGRRGKEESSFGHGVDC